MDPKLKELLQPEILNTVSGLELMARIVVEGFMSGSNKSHTIGAGQEFSQYRMYEPGDDLRQLDWKMYARSERYFIKQSEIETNITVKFMLDASNSMAYSEDGISKLQYAKIMIAALAYLARKQGDAIGLFGFNDQRVTVVQPRFEQQQFMRFLNELVSIKSESKWLREDKASQAYHHQRKEMIIFITDLYDDQKDLLTFISRLKTSRNEVIVFHVMGEKETTLAFHGSYTFEDLETGQKIKVDSEEAKKEYTKHFEEWIQTCRDWMLEKQISYVPVVSAQPVEQVLRDFLKVRKTMAR